MANGTLSGPGMAASDMALGRLGGVDLSILDVMAPVDKEAQRKYDAMGLPDPVAFAALTALGAIPNPMAMLNAMMLRAQERIEAEEAARLGLAPRPAVQVFSSSTLPSRPPGLSLPPGKSFVEAFREMERQQETSSPDVVVQGLPTLGEKPKPAGPSTGYAAQRVAPTTNLPVMEAAVVEATDSAEVEKLEERLAKQAKELAEQAKIVSERLKSKDGAAAAAGWTTLPTERGLKQAFASGEDDLAEQQEMPARPSVVPLLTLSSLLTGIQTSATEAAATPDRPPLVEDPQDVQKLPEYLKPKEDRKEKEKKKRSPSRPRRSKERDKKNKKRRSRSMVRWLDRSRSNSHTNTGQYIRATGCSSTVRSWQRQTKESSSSESSGRKKKNAGQGRRKKSRSASSDRSRKRSRSRRKFTEAKKDDEKLAAAAAASSKRPRQVAVRGHWAQFVLSGKAYYFNIATRTCTWDRPSDLDAPADKPPKASKSAAGSSKLVATTGTSSTLL